MTHPITTSATAAALREIGKPRHPGVKFWAAHGLWSARITINRRRRYLGTFPTYEEAVAARQRAERNMGLTPEERAARQAVRKG